MYERGRSVLILNTSQNNKASQTPLELVFPFPVLLCLLHIFPEFAVVIALDGTVFGCWPVCCCNQSDDQKKCDLGRRHVWMIWPICSQHGLESDQEYAELCLRLKSCSRERFCESSWLGLCAERAKEKGGGRTESFYRWFASGGMNQEEEYGWWVDAGWYRDRRNRHAAIHIIRKRGYGEWLTFCEWRALRKRTKRVEDLIVLYYTQSHREWFLLHGNCLLSSIYGLSIYVFLTPSEDRQA